MSLDPPTASRPRALSDRIRAAYARRRLAAWCRRYEIGRPLKRNSPPLGVAQVRGWAAMQNLSSQADADATLLGSGSSKRWPHRTNLTADNQMTRKPNLA